MLIGKVADSQGHPVLWRYYAYCSRTMAEGLMISVMLFPSGGKAHIVAKSVELKDGACQKDS